MKEPLRVGDRVAVYGPGWGVRSNEGSWREPKEGRWSGVVSLVGPIYIAVKPDYESPNWRGLRVYPGQCRRLVKRERRRVWVRAEEIGNESIHDDDITFDLDGQLLPANRDDWVEFVEVKKCRQQTESAMKALEEAP